jgi:hypothetical protein
MKRLMIFTAALFAGAGMMFAENTPNDGVYGTEAVSGAYLLDEYPGVAKRVSIGGFELDVDRTHWGIDNPQGPDKSYLGGFRSHSVDISVSRLSSTTTPGDVLESYPVSTSHGVHGTKVVLGQRVNFLVQHITAIRYIFTNRSGQTICFEARGIAPHPNWYRANKLILDSLSYPRA